jgi:hypothetical protein
LVVLLVQWLVLAGKGVVKVATTMVQAAALQMEGLFFSTQQHCCHSRWREVLLVRAPYH